jgi:hypothetical protein
MEQDYFWKGTIEAFHIFVPWTMSVCNLVCGYAPSLLPTVRIRKKAQTRHSENLKSNIE